MKILLLSFYDLGKQPKIISELYQKLNNGTNEIDIVDYSVEEKEELMHQLHLKNAPVVVYTTSTSYSSSSSSSYSSSSVNHFLNPSFYPDKFYFIMNTIFLICYYYLL